MPEGEPAVAPPAPRPDRVLVLCSANRCRSPLAGALLAREARRRRLPIEVLSAGFGEPGLPATPPTVDAAAELGLDLGAHESRQVDRALLSGADLVLGMERLHVREAVVLEASVWRRTFTLREAVRRVETTEPRPPDEALRAWFESLSVVRERADLMGSSDEDDVRDPTTDWSVDHATTASLLDDLVQRLLSRAWPA